MSENQAKEKRGIECPGCGEIEFIVKEMKAKTPEAG